MFGAIANGKKLFYKWTEKQNSKEFILFLQEFIKTLNRKKKYLFFWIMPLGINLKWLENI